MSWQLAYGRTRGRGVGSLFKHLQSIVSSGSSSKFMSNCSILTKTDTKFEATTHLLLTASWLLSAANVLDEYVKVISNDESSCSLINKKPQHMKRYIVPWLRMLPTLLWKSAKALHPFPQWILSTVEWKPKGRVKLLMCAATVVLVPTCN